MHITLFNVFNTFRKMHYPPETGTIMLIVRLMAMYKQSHSKEDFLQSLQSFQSLIVNTEQKIYHKMLGEHFEQQMEELFVAFCRAFADEKLAAVSEMFSHTVENIFKHLLLVH